MVVNKNYTKLVGEKCKYCGQQNYSTLDCKGEIKSVNLANKNMCVDVEKLKTNYIAGDI